jgi:energy-coupling factor transporter ATP-binding protein EcfA2
MPKPSKPNPGHVPSEPAPPGLELYFKEVTLRNIRCFGDRPQTLKLTDKDGRPSMWNVILGNNGTGKSTVLQVMGMVRRYRDLEYWKKRGDCVVAVDSKSRRFLGLEDFQPRETMPSPHDRYEGPSSAGATVAIALCLGSKKSSETVSIDARWHVLSSENSVAPIREGAWLLAAYGPIRRLAGGSQVVHVSGEYSSVVSLFRDDAQLRNAEEWLLQADYSAAKPSNIQRDLAKNVDRIKSLLCDILPDVGQVRISEPSHSQPTPQVQFKTPYGWVGLQDLGHGYKSMVSWIVDFASRMFETYSHLAEPLHGPAVCLVDEIDLHLHPTWQRNIMSFLRERFPKTQFIVTAHSPLMVQAAEDANLALLRREGDHVVIDNDIERVRNWRVDQILTSDLFGLETARPPSVEPAIKERSKILSKGKLTRGDKAKLSALESAIGDLPAGESLNDAKKLMALIEDTNKLIKQHKGVRK